jgi:hypothetical protein
LQFFKISDEKDLWTTVNEELGESYDSRNAAGTAGGSKEKKNQLFMEGN